MTTEADSARYPIDENDGPVLLIPELCCDEYSPDLVRRDGLVRRQAELYLSARTYSTEKAVKRASVEIASVSKCFPTILDSNIILSMTAWFGFLCYVDDAIERLDNEQAEAVIIESIHILQDGNHHPDNEKTSTTSCEISPVPILNLSRALVSHTRGLLPDHVHSKFLHATINVWRAMLSELEYRRQDSIDEKEYFAIRKETVGLGPLFVLGQYYLGVSDQHEDVQTMLLSTRLAVGLQNDLVGLKRDLAQGAVFNYILITREEEIDQRRIKAIELHNDAVRRMLECRQAMAFSSDPGVQAYADCLLVLVRMHFFWSTASRRYVAVQVPSTLRGRLAAAMQPALGSWYCFASAASSKLRRATRAIENQEGCRGSRAAKAN